MRLSVGYKRVYIVNPMYEMMKLTAGQTWIKVSKDNQRVIDVGVGPEDSTWRIIHKPTNKYEEQYILEQLVDINQWQEFNQTP